MSLALFSLVPCWLCPAMWRCIPGYGDQYVQIAQTSSIVLRFPPSDAISPTQDTPARWRMLSFYTLVFAENAALTALFALYWPHPWDALYTVLLANVALGTALG